MNCEYCNNHEKCIKNIPIFSNLSLTEVNEIEKLIIHSDYLKKTVIFREGDILDRLIIIRGGKIKLVRFGLDGEEILLDILVKGDLYGGDNIFTNSKVYENVITIEDSNICFIKNADLKNLLLSNSHIGLKIIEYMNSMINNQKTLLEIISIKDTNKKIARFLIERSRRINSNTITITQEDIGNSINLTKETVNRRLSWLQDQNIIKIQGQKNIIILDKDRLENLFNLPKLI